MPQEHIIEKRVSQTEKPEQQDQFYELGVTKEDIDTRLKDHEDRIQDLE